MPPRTVRLGATPAPNPAAAAAAATSAPTSATTSATTSARGVGVPSIPGDEHELTGLLPQVGDQHLDVKRHAKLHHR